MLKNCFLNISYRDNHGRFSLCWSEFGMCGGSLCAIRRIFVCRYDRRWSSWSTWWRTVRSGSGNALKSMLMALYLLPNSSVLCRQPRGRKHHGPMSSIGDGSRRSAGTITGPRRIYIGFLQKFSARVCCCALLFIFTCTFSTI